MKPVRSKTTLTGEVLPATVPGWDVFAVNRQALNLNLPSRYTLESAQARRGDEIALLVGVKPDPDTAPADLYREVVNELGAPRTGPVAIDGGGVPSRQSASYSFVLPLLSWTCASAQSTSPEPPPPSPPPLARTITSPTTTASPIRPATT